MSRLNLNYVLTKTHQLSGIPPTRCSANSYMCSCPAHADSTASLSVKAEGDRILMWCFAGCGYQSIVEALKLPSKKRKLEIRENPAPWEKEVDPLHKYDYYYPDGTLAFQKVRFVGEKSFTFRRITDSGGWSYKRESPPTILYNAHLLSRAEKDDLVLLTEGEKDANNGSLAFNIITTTNHDGASNYNQKQKWHDEYNEQLRGKRVLIFPDFDYAGILRAVFINKSLKEVNISSLLLFPDLSYGEDLSDWIAKGNGPKEFSELVQYSRLLGPEDRLSIVQAIIRQR